MTDEPQAAPAEEPEQIIGPHILSVIEDLADAAKQIREAKIDEMQSLADLYELAGGEISRLVEALVMVRQETLFPEAFPGVWETLDPCRQVHVSALVIVSAALLGGGEAGSPA